MENYYVEKQTAEESGIYIIVNIMDAKAYVGKATDLSNRTHKQDLRRKFDNQNLQADYDKGVKLVYFKLFYDTNYNDYLFNYEKFYMTLVEDYGGFELYNRNGSGMFQKQYIHKSYFLVGNIRRRIVRQTNSLLDNQDGKGWFH